MLTVEEGKHRDFGPCACCGGTTRSIWGYVSKDGVAYAVYYAQWTRDQPKHGGTWLVSIGGWADEDETVRARVGLESRAPEGRIQFMLIDAQNTPWAAAPGLGASLKRSEVVGTPLAQDVFAVVDAVLAQDHRSHELVELLEGGAPPPPRPAWRRPNKKRR